MKPHPIIQAISKYLTQHNIKHKIMDAQYSQSYIKVPLGYWVHSINIATHKATVWLTSFAPDYKSIKTWNLADPKLLQELTNIIKSTITANPVDPRQQQSQNDNTSTS